MKKSKSDNIQYKEVYTISYNKLISLRAKSFYDDFYIKESDIYTYIHYMPFANFNLMHYINFQAKNYLMNNTKAIVVCLENCVEYVRGDLDEKVEVICVSMY